MTSVHSFWLFSTTDVFVCTCWGAGHRCRNLKWKEMEGSRRRVTKATKFHFFPNDKHNHLSTWEGLSASISLWPFLGTGYTQQFSFLPESSDYYLSVPLGKDMLISSVGKYCLGYHWWLPFVINSSLVLSLEFSALHNTLCPQFQSSIGSSFYVTYSHPCLSEYEFGKLRGSVSL